MYHNFQIAPLLNVASLTHHTMSSPCFAHGFLIIFSDTFNKVLRTSLMFQKSENTLFSIYYYRKYHFIHLYNVTYHLLHVLQKLMDFRNCFHVTQRSY